jgi:hypothetical protein
MNKVGRPKETLDSLPNGWQDTLLKLYEQGGSDEEAKAVIYHMRGSFSNNLWERWMESEEQFWETIKMGRLLSAAWWTHKGRTSLENQQFSYTGWYMNMKNRFGWRDKTETQHSGELKQTQIIYQLSSGNEPIKEN